LGRRDRDGKQYGCGERESPPGRWHGAVIAKGLRGMSYRLCRESVGRPALWRLELALTKKRANHLGLACSQLFDSKIGAEEGTELLCLATKDDDITAIHNIQ
jgi:hypothetical protein